MKLLEQKYFSFIIFKLRSFIVARNCDNSLVALNIFNILKILTATKCEVGIKRGKIPT